MTVVFFNFSDSSISTLFYQSRIRFSGQSLDTYGPYTGLLFIRFSDEITTGPYESYDNKM